MMDNDIDDRLRRFEDDLRRWGSKPPGTPAHIARVRVSARLEDVRHPFPWLRLAAAAAMLVVLALAVWRGAPRPAGDVRPRTAVLLQPTLDPNVVVWFVDGHTTVYFVLSPDGLAKGGVS
jgi:hypothetical protein